MQTVMLQFRHKGATPTVDEVRRLFDLQADEIDAQFGVIATDPREGLYTVRVADKAKARAAAALAKRPVDQAEGIFANPRIEPFGPPAE